MDVTERLELSSRVSSLGEVICYIIKSCHISMPIYSHFVTVTPNVKKCINDVYEVVYWDHFAVVCFDASYSCILEQMWGIE